MKTIELSKFTKTFSRWGGADPFTIAFVYSPKGNCVVKGMPNDVSEYIDNHFPQAVINMTYWKDGQSRNYWTSSKNNKIYFFKKRFGKRIKTEISIFTSNGREVIGIVRKIPHRWLPQYNKALSRGF